MLRSASAAAAMLIVGVAGFGHPAAAGDAMEGQSQFKRCRACHAVGPGARNKVGPHLNEVFGRKAGTLASFRSYSRSMKKAGADGLVWNEETMHRYLENPRRMIRGTRMAFAGLRNKTMREDLIAYLKQFSGTQTGKAPAAASAAEPKKSAAQRGTTVPSTAIKKSADAPRHGRFNLGRVATAAEIAAWDIDVRPDGQGLPKGKGTVLQGEELYSERCASCHGDFGEGVGRWPVLAGGADSLTSDRPEKTVGSYWPYLSTVWDYVHRAMPFGDAQSLTNDEVYAIVAYLLFLNDVVGEESFELSDKNFSSIRLPNENGFVMDDRAKEPHAKPKEPCMKDCFPQPAKIKMRARILDVTPEADDANAEQAKGAIE